MVAEGRIDMLRAGDILVVKWVDHRVYGGHNDYLDGSRGKNATVFDIFLAFGLADCFWFEVRVTECTEQMDKATGLCGIGDIRCRSSSRTGARRTKKGLERFPISRLHNRSL